MSDNLECRSYFPVAWDIETRRRGGRRVSGSVPYNSPGVISNRGRGRSRPRKEVLLPGSFEFALTSPDRDISLLHGHEFNQILASKLSNTLEFEDTKKALNFRAIFPEASARTQAQNDALRNIEQGLVAGVSPGFLVAGVPDAFDVVREVGNPDDIYIKRIKSAVLVELSLTARPVYKESEVAIREERNIINPGIEDIVWTF